LCCDPNLGLRSGRGRVASDFCNVGVARLGSRCFGAVLVAVVASVVEGGSSLLVVFADMALSSLERCSSQDKAGIVVEAGNHEVVAAVVEGMLSMMVAAYSHMWDYGHLLADVVARVVADTVAAFVAEMNMGLVGGCLAVHVQLACRDSILEPPSLLTVEVVCEEASYCRDVAIKVRQNIRSECCRRWCDTVRDSKITRPWLNKYQERVQLSPVHT